WQPAASTNVPAERSIPRGANRVRQDIPRPTATYVPTPTRDFSMTAVGPRRIASDPYLVPVTYSLRPHSRRQPSAALASASGFGAVRYLPRAADGASHHVIARRDWEAAESRSTRA